MGGCRGIEGRVSGQRHLRNGGREEDRGTEMRFLREVRERGRAGVCFLNHHISQLS